jgi:radical SAM protein with 4Fe4S-binding SPASM domain
VIDDVKTDSRLKGLNSIVFLMLKQKGRGESFTKISEKHYNDIINKSLKEKIRFGFDSCSATLFQNSIYENKDYEEISKMVDACESTLFSMYINAFGLAFPCSFAEGTWEGIAIRDYMNFLKEVWYSDEFNKFRKKLLGNKCKKTGCRKCPIYDLDFSE